MIMRPVVNSVPVNWRQRTDLCELVDGRHHIDHVVPEATAFEAIKQALEATALEPEIISSTNQASRWRIRRPGFPVLDFRLSGLTYSPIASGLASLIFALVWNPTHGRALRRGSNS
jgi:hypothetical protein